jgi:Lrp/AsnC family leucine-responsive transcriptional regulator
MATSYRIDDTDRRILRVLQVDGRISNQDLALRCNLSPSACSDRVRRLREQGIISGYAAVLDPSKVDRPLLIFVEVVLDRTTGDVFEAFAAAARRSPEVMECHMVAGGFDYLIKARVGPGGDAGRPRDAHLRGARGDQDLDVPADLESNAPDEVSRQKERPRLNVTERAVP